MAQKKPKQVKAPNSLKTDEREFGEQLDTMISMMSRQWKNQTLLALNKGTVDKFADAQVGNYAKIFTTLTNRVKRKLLRRFSNDRLTDFVTQMLTRVDDRNRKQLYSRIEQKIGISTERLTKQEAMKAGTNALITETVQWVQKLRDDTLTNYTANSLRAMALGQSLDEVMTQFDGLVEKRKNHAKMVARTQIANFNSILTKTRAQNLGITHAIWDSSEDGRVRPSHADREGKEFDLSKGCYSRLDGKWMLPGVDYSCRCTYHLIIPED